MIIYQKKEKTLLFKRIKTNSTSYLWWYVRRTKDVFCIVRL